MTMPVHQCRALTFTKDVSTLNDTASFEDRKQAGWLFDFLEDRRVLYNPNYAENPEFVIVSVTEIRNYLTTLLTSQQSGELLVMSARSMRGACRRMLDCMQPFEFREGLPGNIDRSKIAGDLGEFRGRIGYEVAQLAEFFQLDVPGDLTKVLPPPPE